MVRARRNGHGTRPTRAAETALRCRNRLRSQSRNTVDRAVLLNLDRLHRHLRDLKSGELRNLNGIKLCRVDLLRYSVESAQQRTAYRPFMR